jgi:hypothetical protein
MGHILPPLRGLPPLAFFPLVCFGQPREREGLKLKAAGVNHRSALCLLWRLLNKPRADAMLGAWRIYLAC